MVEPKEHYIQTWELDQFGVDKKHLKVMCVQIIEKNTEMWTKKPWLLFCAYPYLYNFSQFIRHHWNSISHL